MVKTGCGSPDGMTPHPAGTPDAGTVDAGPDAETPDAGTPDAGTPDAGTPDAGTPDAGTPDAGTPDAGTPDAGTPDAGTPDAAMPDAAVPDAAVPDAAVPDAATPDAAVPDAAVPDAGTPDAGTPDASTPDAGTPPADVLIPSRTVTFTCLGDPCPWGDSVSTQAVVWPASEGTVNTQLGYLVSAGMFLPGERANGTDISIETGEATVYWGFPDEEPLHWLATLQVGDAFHVDGIPSDSVLSVQSDSPFTSRITLPPSTDPGPGGNPANAISSTQAVWRCNLPGCTFPAWTGAVIHWPPWAAYQSNARAGDQSRSVFTADGTPLFPYMGSWAQGCEVIAESGVVLIIEWQRGTNMWRETWLYPRQSHVIDLVSPEDGALIETYNGSPGFSASLRNCTPQPLSQARSRPPRSQATVRSGARTRRVQVDQTTGPLHEGARRRR